MTVAGRVGPTLGHACVTTTARTVAHDTCRQTMQTITVLIQQEATGFIVLWSPETAEHDPDYRPLGSFAKRRQAETFARLVRALDYRD